MKFEDLPLKSLRLDEENPRLPESLSARTQSDLLRWIANEYNTIDVARSMALHGYFESEPLIAIKEASLYVVVEGNRRLTALKLLVDDTLRRSLELEDESEWAELATQAKLPATFPVLVANDRKEVAPVIGYRHIAGIEPWDPWAKVRFIAKQVEDEHQSFETVASIVGEKESEVRGHYRNYRIAIEAEGKLKVSAKRVRQQFGTFTRAMNSVGLRNHIGAPAPAQVIPGEPVLVREKEKEVKELFSWLFGDENHEPAIKESRQLSELGEVVARPESLKVMRKTRDIDEALSMSNGTRARLINKLRRATSALEQAGDDIEGYCDDKEVIVMLDELTKLLGALRNK